LGKVWGHGVFYAYILKPYFNRPQNDGPAERAIAMLQIASSYQQSDFINTTIIPMILRDLYYVVSVWQQPCYDLWEEIEGVHFYTLMVMRRALLDGADYFYSHDASVFSETAEKIKHRIESFWDPAKNYIIATQDVRNGVLKPSGLDASTILAVNLASRDDGKIKRCTFVYILGTRSNIIYIYIQGS
jgi:glucoamylase